jgi:Protein of unknown function (DUF2009)
VLPVWKRLCSLQLPHLHFGTSITWLGTAHVVSRLNKANVRSAVARCNARTRRTLLALQPDQTPTMQEFFDPNSCTDPESSLAISMGRGGARLSHGHQKQYTYVLQSLTLCACLPAPPHALVTWCACHCYAASVRGSAGVGASRRVLHAQGARSTTPCSCCGAARTPTCWPAAMPTASATQVTHPACTVLRALLLWRLRQTHVCDGNGSPHAHARAHWYDIAEKQRPNTKAHYMQARG